MPARSPPVAASAAGATRTGPVEVGRSDAYPVDVHFRIEQAVAAPPDRVVAAFGDPERFDVEHQVPEVGAPRILQHRSRKSTVELRLRYHYIGSLSPAARRVLDPDKLTWVQELTVRAAERRAEFRMVPDHYPDRLRCHGQFLFDELDGGASTLQVMQGELVVSFPLVGPVVERGLLSGVRRYLAAEAPALAKLAGTA